MALFLVMCAPTSAHTQEVTVIKNPPADSPYFALMDGLRLIKENKYDAFISQWCSPQQLCTSQAAIQNLKRYNLPPLERLAPSCLKQNGKAIYVTRVDKDPASDETVRVFIRCQEEGIPKPFTLVHEGGWKFKSL